MLQHPQRKSVPSVFIFFECLPVNIENDQPIEMIDQFFLDILLIKEPFDPVGQNLWDDQKNLLHFVLNALIFHYKLFSIQLTK